MEINTKLQKELESITAKSDSIPKFGAMIVRGDEIISTGYAHYASDSKHEDLLIHAEESALLNALNDHVDINQADIYVLGIRENGDIRHTDGSYCCILCSRLLTQTKIANIFFPTSGGWEKFTVDQMYAKAIERVASV